MPDKTDSIKQEDMKIEDILKSIRGIIDERNQEEDPESNLVKKNSNIENVDSDDSILELTSVVPKDNKHEEQSNNDLLSSTAKQKTELELKKFASHAKDFDYPAKENSLDSMMNELMKPLIKNWLDSNLPKVVEKVVSEEIKKMIPKK
ncbi:MAG: DUF2497 domain-containing protein [Rickettsiaceae bacterium]|nr:DUF2497 domain-containing protein [Rickettsiaceae bacterium]